MPRFVILEHETDDDVHYDLMLEGQDALWTWSFSEFPAAGMTCRRLFDHRMKYLDYEGDVGVGRGTVKRVAAGTFDIMNFEPECVSVRLRGDRLSGNCRLTHAEGEHWRFECD